MKPKIDRHHCPECERAFLVLRMTDQIVALNQENADLKQFINGLLAGIESRRTINTN